MEADPEFGELASRWWDYWRRFRGTRDERKALSVGEPAEVVAAHDQVEAQVNAGGRSAVELLVALNDAAPPGDDGLTVGVGPLGDLLHEHADALINDIEHYARVSASFRQALAHVSLERGRVSRDTEHQLSPWIGSLTNSA